MTGFYLPEYNFSVRLVDGVWCMFCRQDDDVLAATAAQRAAIFAHANTNKRKAL